MARRQRLTRYRSIRLALAIVAGWVAGCSSPEGIASVGLVAVAVSPESVTLQPGDTVRLSGRATDDNGVGYAGARVVWRTTDPAIAVISQRGLLTAVGIGSTTVVARVLNLDGRATVVVESPPTPVLSSSTLSFTATAGGADPADQSVTITNSGGGTLDAISVGGVVYAAGPTGWLTTELIADPYTLTARVSVAGLSAGTYSATVPVGVAGSTSVVLTVSLVVS